MISDPLNSNQEVAAFMSLARMNMIVRGHKFESLLRSGRMKWVSYGIKELKLRHPESRLADIPEIAFSEALLNTGFANIKVSTSDARIVLGHTLERINSSALGKTQFEVIISAHIPNEFYTLHIIMFDGKIVVEENGETRLQTMRICLVSAREELAAKIKELVPTLDIDEKVESELNKLFGDTISKYYKEEEIIAVFDLDRREGLKEELDSVLDSTTGMGMGYELFISTGTSTPLMAMTEYNRTSLEDGTVTELTQEVLEKNAEEYRRQTEMLDALSDDFLAIGSEYPWEFALAFMSEGAFYGYEWERKGSIFQNIKYKHPVARLKVKGGGSHKFILHWDTECYRIEITDMEPDSDLGKVMSSFGLSFQTTPNKKKQ